MPFSVSSPFRLCPQGLILWVVVLGLAGCSRAPQPALPTQSAIKTAVSADGFPAQFHDVWGRQVVVPARPQRVISLAPSMTEWIFALGAGDRLMADTTFCVHPPEAVAKEKIGGIMNPDLEKIIRLHPDLVVGSELTPREVVDQIDQLHIPAVYFRHTTIESVYHDMFNLAILLGDRSRGEALVAQLRARGEVITGRVRSLPTPRPRVLLLLRIDGLFSAGKGTFPHELIELAGGDNIAARATTLWPHLAMETIIEANPDVILVAIGEGKVEKDFLTTTWQRMRADPRWRQINAVARNRLALIPDDLMTIPGPRMMEALETVARGLHPEAFPIPIDSTGSLPNRSVLLPLR